MKKIIIFAQIAALICTVGTVSHSGANTLNIIAGILLLVSITLNILEEVKDAKR